MEKNGYAIERDYEKIGTLLQKARTNAGLTQRNVADKLRYSSAQFISNFERGISLPPLRKLKLLIDLYGLSVEELLELIVEAEGKRLTVALCGKKKSRTA